jgi:hypothetical protein
MNSKIIVQPLWSKILLIIIDLFLIVVLIKSIPDRGFILKYHILFILFLTIFVFLTISAFIEYQFNYYYISVKYPFGIIKKYDMDDVIGYKFETNNESGGLIFCIYVENKTLYITLSGSKSENIALEFFNNNYEKIKNKNIEKIINGVMEINLNKRKKYIFYKEKFEQIINKKVNVYYYDKDISRIEIKRFKLKKLFGKNTFETKTLVMQTYDDKKIKLSDHKCKGGIGLFEYLENVQK